MIFITQVLSTCVCCTNMGKKQNRITHARPFKTQKATIVIQLLAQHCHI